MYLVAIYWQLSNLVAAVQQQGRRGPPNAPVPQDLQFPLAYTPKELFKICFEDQEEWMLRQGGNNVLDGVRRIMLMVAGDDVWQQINRTGRHDKERFPDSLLNTLSS